MSMLHHFCFLKKLPDLSVFLSMQVTEDRGKFLGRTERTNLLILLILALHSEIYLDFHYNCQVFHVINL